MAKPNVGDVRRLRDRLRSGTVTVSVEIELSDIADDDLVFEVESRGYFLHNKAPPAPIGDVELLDEAAWRLNRGNSEEALRLLARALGAPFSALADLARRLA